MEDRFDTTKARLKEFVVPVSKVAIPSVLSTIPGIGPLVYGVVDATLTAFQEKKRKELVDIVLTGELITSERVNTSKTNS